MYADVAVSMANRRGVVRLKHLEVRPLWLQNLTTAGDIVVRKVKAR